MQGRGGLVFAFLLRFDMSVFAVVSDLKKIIASPSEPIHFPICWIGHDSRLRMALSLQ